MQHCVENMRFAMKPELQNRSVNRFAGVQVANTGASLEQERVGVVVRLDAMRQHFVVVEYAGVLEMSGFCKGGNESVEKEGVVVMRL